MENGPFEDVFPITVKMAIFQPAMLDYPRVGEISWNKCVTGLTAPNLSLCHWSLSKENGDGGPLIINPIYTLYHVGIYWGPYSLLKGSDRGVKQRPGALHPKGVPTIFPMTLQGRATWRIKDAWLRCLNENRRFWVFFFGRQKTPP